MAKKTITDKIKNRISAFIDAHKSNILSAGKAVDNRIKEEILQFKKSDGLGHYLTSNVVTVVSSTASKIGMSDLAEKVKSYRREIESAGKNFDKKVSEEWQQYQQMNGIGEYVTHNLTSVLSMTARTVGADEVAQKIEGKRGEFVAAGKSFDKKASEEWQQYQQMNGIGEYVTHNLTSVLSMTARTVGADEVAQKIEDKRGEFVAAGKSFDKKAREEWQQYQQMNSPFQYFSKNMLSVVEKTADVAHLNDVSQLVKDNRVAIEEAGKKLDERLKAEYRNFNQSEGLGQYLSQRVVDAGKAMSDEQHHSTVKATVPSIRQTDAVVIPDRTAQFLHQPYNNAEIKTSESKNGLITEVTLLDGKKHGLEISWDKDGKICQINAYEHGKVVSVEGNQIEIFDEEVNGQKHTYSILNGKMFGTEKFSDKDGNLMLAFHESDGLTIPRTLTAKVSLTNVKDEDLKQKLKEDWLCSQKIMHARSNIKTVNNYIGMATKKEQKRGNTKSSEEQLQNEKSKYVHALMKENLVDGM